MNSLRNGFVFAACLCALMAVGWAGNDRDALHALQRVGFGPRPGDIERVREMGVKAYIERQLAPESIDDSALEERLKNFKALEASSAELFELLLRPGRRPDRGAPATEDERNDFLRERREMRRAQRGVYLDLAQARLCRAVFSRRQLQEVMVDFWMNHFNVFMGKGPVRALVPSFERDVIRPHAMGRFENLLLATAQSPAMLFYLDNWISSAPEDVLKERFRKRYPTAARALMGRGGARGARRRMSRQDRQRLRDVLPSDFFVLRRAKGLNENYARELLELHTVGVEGGYTQEDVIEVARALTGWTISDPRNGARFAFRPIMHVEGEKRLMGRTFRQEGRKQGEALLRFLARHPATADFISFKLARRFVADDPPPALVRRAAQAFRETGGDIREVLRAIFTSPEFLSPEFRAAKIKKPLELVASSLRATGAEWKDGRSLVRALRELGEPLYLCRPPTGYPDTADEWINTNTLLQRLNFAIALASGRLPGQAPDLEAARSVFEALGVPEPDARQIEETGRIAEESGQGAPLPQGDERERVLAAAFKLGSPDFQKK